MSVHVQVWCVHVCVRASVARRREGEGEREKENQRASKQELTGREWTGRKREHKNESMFWDDFMKGVNLIASH